MIRLALLGHPVAHSVSPAMHNAALRHVGLQGTYELIDVSPEHLQGMFEGLPSKGVLGVNVTVPHKLSVASLCAELDPIAREIGAVNTVRFEPDGTARGWNTDIDGFIDSLQVDAGFLVSGKRALILGAGGAARAAVHALKHAGAEAIIISNRTTETARRLANSVGASVVEMEHDVLVGCQPDLVINATSVGLSSHRDAARYETAERFVSLLPLHQWEKPMVYDLVYTPRETPLLRAAQTAGCATLDGLGMLVHQGAKAFGFWTGVSPERVVTVMREAAEKAIADRLS